MGKLKPKVASDFPTGQCNQLLVKLVACWSSLEFPGDSFILVGKVEFRERDSTWRIPINLFQILGSFCKKFIFY